MIKYLFYMIFCVLARYPYFAKDGKHVQYSNIPITI